MPKLKLGGPKKPKDYNKPYRDRNNPRHGSGTVLKVLAGTSLALWGLSEVITRADGVEGRPSAESTVSPGESPSVAESKKKKQPSGKNNPGSNNGFQADLRRVMGDRYIGDGQTEEVNIAGDPRAMVDSVLDTMAERPDLDVTRDDVACTIAALPSNSKIVGAALETREGARQAARAVDEFGGEREVANACISVVVIGAGQLAGRKTIMEYPNL